MTDYTFEGARDHVEWFLKDEGFPDSKKLATTLVQGLWENFESVVTGAKYRGVPCEFVLTSMAFACGSMPAIELTALERHQAFLLHGRTLAVMGKHPGLILYPQDHKVLAVVTKDFINNVNELLETPDYMDGFNLPEWLDSLNLAFNLEVFAKTTTDKKST